VSFKTVASWMAWCISWSRQKKKSTAFAIAFFRLVLPPFSVLKAAIES
jgi:ABC-type glycerol-3-phosphate transport system permease component